MSGGHWMRVEGCAPSSTGLVSSETTCSWAQSGYYQQDIKDSKAMHPLDDKQMISKDTTGTQGSPAHLRWGLQAPRSSPFPHRQPRWTWRELRALLGRLGHNRSSSSLRILSQPRLQAGNSQACSWVLFTKVWEPGREGQPPGQLGCGF